MTILAGEEVSLYSTIEAIKSAALQLQDILNMGISDPSPEYFEAIKATDLLLNSPKQYVAIHGVEPIDVCAVEDCAAGFNIVIPQSFSRVLHQHNDMVDAWEEQQEAIRKRSY